MKTMTSVSFGEVQWMCYCDNNDVDSNDNNDSHLVYWHCHRVGSLLYFCYSLLAGTSVSNLTRLQRVQNTLARVVAQNHGSATSNLSFLICIGFRLATELASKLLRSRSECSSFFRPPILHLLSQDMYRRRALCSSSSLSICVPPRKTTMATPKSF